MTDLFGYMPAEEGPLDRLEAVGGRLGRRLEISPWLRTSLSIAGGAALGVRGLEETSLQDCVASDATSGVRLALAGLIGGHEQEPRAQVASRALDAYLAHGPEGLTSLQGEFITCVWDGRSHECLLVNDRFGLLPHYYAHGGFGFAFAPTIRALLDVPGLRARADLAAVGEYLRLQQLLDDRTWVEDVKLLPPGSVLRYQRHSGRVSVSRYWDWSKLDQVRTTGFHPAVARCTDLFQDAVDRRLAGAVRPGIFLSGGLDARTLLAFARAPVATLTFGTHDCRDVVLAARLAARAGAEHHWFPLENGSWILEHAAGHLAATEGMHSWIHAHAVTTLDPARSLVDVVLSGWDGGTILGGSINFYNDAPFRIAGDESILASNFFRGFCRSFTWPGLSDEEGGALLDTGAGRPLRDVARNNVAAALARTRDWPPRIRGDAFYVEQVVRRSLQNQVTLARTALDVRCPYFDYALVDFLYTLPQEIRTSPRLRRAVLARRNLTLALVPHERDLRLPHPSRALVALHAVAQRALQGARRRGAPVGVPESRLYADYENYLRHELRPWGESLLFDERTLARGFYERKTLRALWERHLSGREPQTIGKIVPVMAIEMALRYLVDGDTAEAACGLRS